MSSKSTPHDFRDETYSDELKPGTKLLHGQYVIEQFLNNGGFGITYLAKDSLLRLVVIKECFPESICRRANSTVRVRSRNQVQAFRAIVDLFIEEARGLARLSHPNIVGVHQVFEDNDTAYMAMDFVEGRDLLEIAESPEVLDPATFEHIVFKLLDAVEFIHKEGVLHRDISPDNILLSKNNEPVLIDFGAARETVTRATSYLGSMQTVKDGYSPQEFYIKDSVQHPSSDLYSLAASLYHVMSKELPVRAQARMSAIASGEPDPYVSIKKRVTGYSEPFLDAIDLALKVFPKDRIQSAAEWRMMIAGSDARRGTRGTVSRPMLAVDNGNVLEQFGEKEKKSPPNSRNRSEKQVSLRASRPATAAKGDLRDNISSQAQVAWAMAPKGGKRGGKGFYFGVAAIAIIAGAAAYFLTQGDSATPEATRAARLEIGSAPDLDASAGSVDDRVAASTPEAATAPASDRVATKPEQVPFFLADTSAGDVVVSSAAKPRLSPSDTSESALSAAEAAAASGTNAASVNRAAQTAPSRQVAGAGTASDLSNAQTARGNALQASVQDTTETDVREMSAVITGNSVWFPVTPDPSDPTIVASAEGPIADYLAPGVRVVSINGFPIESLADFQRVMDATSEYSAGDDVEVAIGIEDPATGEAIVRSVALPALHRTMLLNGVVFETRKEGDTWSTVVSNGLGQGEADLQTGDRIVALMPSNELIDGQEALPRVLRRELEAGTTQFSFAVRRGGDMWLVTMPYAAGIAN